MTTPLEVGDSAEVFVDGDSAIGTVMAVSPRIVTLQFHGNLFGHAKQTFNRKTGLPTGFTERVSPTARLQVDWRSPTRDEESSQRERARLQRELYKAPKAPPAPRLQPAVKSAPVEESRSTPPGWSAVADRNGLVLQKRETTSNGNQFFILHRQSRMGIGPIGPYKTRREGMAVFDAVAPLFDWTMPLEEFAALANGPQGDEIRRRIYDAAKSAVLNLPTQSKQPWQVNLFVIDPARPGVRQQRRFTVSVEHAKTAMEAVKAAVREAVLRELQYVDTIGVHQGY